MRKGDSSTAPPLTVNTRGKIQFNYNVTPYSKTDPMTNELRNGFEFDYVRVDKFERDSLINAIIENKYTKDQEIAIINNELATPGTSAYVEYQAYRANTKVIVDTALGNVVTPTIPTSISMRQARLQLLALNKLTAVNGAIASMPESAQIEWEYATVVARNNPLVTAMTQLLTWTSTDVDNYFIEAYKL